MNSLISTSHFRLHNSTAHLSHVLQLSWSFETQWHLLCWKYKINEFYFGTNTKSTNLRIHELEIFNQSTKIDTHEEKYFHSINESNVKSNKVGDISIIIVSTWIYFPISCYTIGIYNILEDSCKLVCDEEGRWYLFCFHTM